MDLKLKGRKAIVTGSTRGIGLRIARQLADEGMDLAICSRTPEAVAATVEELKKKGVNVIGDAVDVSDGEAYPAWIASAAERMGGLAEIGRYPIDHFQIYCGEHLERAAADQIDFFTRVFSGGAS